MMNETDEILLKEAKMMGPSGVVDRPLRSGVLRVPSEVWIEKDRLMYRLYDEHRRSSRKEKRPTAGMFQQFIELDGKEPKAFRRYAEKWGVLGLCEHGLPYMHNWPTGTERPGCLPRGFPEKCWEPLSTWRNVVSRFLACLRIAASLPDGGDGRPEDWRLLVGDDIRKRRKQHRITVLLAQVNNALYLGRVNPTITCRSGSFSVELGSPGWVNLYGALACQLSLAVCRTDGLANCSACGMPYVITGRRPNPNRRSYCQTCGRTAAVRDASRDYRRRKKEAALD